MKVRRKSKEVEAFQLTKETRASNATWPSWMHAAWQKPRFAQDSLFPHLMGAGVGPIGWCDQEFRVTKVNMGDWLVCEDGMIVACMSPNHFLNEYEPLS